MAEAQAPERVVAPVGGASIATIESLRARLLSERAASKEARQHAHKIALKVSDLQSRLDAEIEHRKKAEGAMKKVLEVLIAKGVAMEEVMAAAPSLSGSSDSGEAVQVNSGDSEHSSGEEASQEYIRSFQGSGTEQMQIMLAVSLGTEAEKEGLIAVAGKDFPRADSFKVEVNFEVEREGVTAGKNSPRADKSEVKMNEVTKDEEIISPDQVLCTDSLEDHPHALLDEVGENSNNDQAPEMPCDSALHLEGDVSVLNDCKPHIYSASGSPSQSLEKAAIPHEGGESNMAPTMSLLGGHQLSAATPKEGVSSHAGDFEKSNGLDGNPVTHISSGLGDKSAHGNEGSHPVDDKMARGRIPRDMAPPISTPGLGHNGVHPILFPWRAYPYEQLYMDADPLQHMHTVPSAEAPFSRGPMSTAYPSRKHLSSDVVEFRRYPQAPVSDAILSLVDDKNGKLGSILMALNLAKQQINDEECVSSHTDEVYEAALPSPFFGKPYPALNEGVPHQAPYRPWRPDPHNQAPIIHLPMSPTSDHEASAFEKHEGMRRSSSTPAYYMPGYDPYLQPKGELHLGNGITLYTD